MFTKTARGKGVNSRWVEVEGEWGVGRGYAGDVDVDDVNES